MKDMLKVHGPHKPVSEKELEELEECFETGTEVDVCGFAQLHHFRYFKASDEVELAGVLPEFFNETEWPVILEVETPRLKNGRGVEKLLPEFTRRMIIY